MIDVGSRQERVQGRINGRGNGIVREGARWIKANHLILKLLAAVYGLQLIEALHVEQCESLFADAAKIAPAAFDGEYGHRLARERVRHLDLGTGVAAPEIRDPEIGAE